MTLKQAQHLLAFLGYYKMSVDGIWGNGSREALASFRQSWGLPAGDALDEAARQALKQAVWEGLPEDSFWKDISFFTREEFKCKCGLYHAPYCDGYPAEPREGLVRIAEAVRRELGRPMTIISGLRCPQHNRDSGGVEGSQHICGEAADVAVSGVSADALLSVIRANPGVRYAYAINDTNVHFDIPQGAR